MTRLIQTITKRVRFCAYLVGFGVLLTGCREDRPAPTPAPAPASSAVFESTDWMPRHVFQAYLTQKEAKDEDGKNFWAKGYCVRKIEGRWEGGYQQYKIDIVKSPTDTAFWWMWYFDMDKAFFQKRLSELGVQGYQLVSFSKNPTPTGEDSFAAVWHKQAPK